jgi:hypothetical protein
MKKLTLLFFIGFLLLTGLLFPWCGYGQVNEVNFNHQTINFSAAPRTTMTPMSIKLWDNYGNGGPAQFGTVMEITGKSGHQTSQLHFGGWDNSKIKYREAFYAQDVWSDWITLLDSKNNVESAGKLLISGSGNHSINGNLSLGTLTPTPGATLTVAGLVSCREVKVAVSAGADHVFNKDYKLMPLGDLEKYVLANKHLPEIASEAEMMTDGVNMNELQIKLLQKIEELTLHLIDVKKETDHLKTTVNNLKTENLLLQSSLKKLTIKRN